MAIGLNELLFLQLSLVVYMGRMSNLLSRIYISR